MPELPEVEEYGRYFTRHALNRTIKRVDVRDERILGIVRKDAFTRRLRGRAFTHVRRHGKHLFVQAGTTWLHLHFGMTGDLLFYRDAAETPRFARVIFDFNDGSHLAFDDMRLFGVVDLIDDPDTFIAEHRLGRDPLDPKFKAADFRKLIAKRRGGIKALLMSQDFVAGLGNLYVDEILYETGIHPRRSAEKIKDLDAIYTTMRKIVRKPNRKLPRDEGELCPKCGGTIKRAVVAGRTTYFCGGHQR
ncbi:MAG TPA: DNA-formamidopyrimidine glycosylase family protein [Thermoanaerobaculia bacterium]|nr:DNA-formamidopyrimidine glycosylase family protein [Thermoanaerobaculia bacterium]